MNDIGVRQKEVGDAAIKAFQIIYGGNITNSGAVSSIVILIIFSVEESL